MKAQKKNGYNADSQKDHGIFCTKLSHEVDLWYDESNMTDVTEVIKKSDYNFIDILLSGRHSVSILIICTLSTCFNLLFILMYSIESEINCYSF